MHGDHAGHAQHVRALFPLSGGRRPHADAKAAFVPLGLPISPTGCAIADLGEARERRGEAPSVPDGSTVGAGVAGHPSCVTATEEATRRGATPVMPRS